MDSLWNPWTACNHNTIPRGRMQSNLMMLQILKRFFKDISALHLCTPFLLQPPQVLLQCCIKTKFTKTYTLPMLLKARSRKIGCMVGHLLLAFDLQDYTDQKNPNKTNTPGKISTHMLQGNGHSVPLG